MDGKVCKGSSYVDQACHRGIDPVRKDVGDNVYAGAINQNGSVEIKWIDLRRNDVVKTMLGRGPGRGTSYQSSPTASRSTIRRSCSSWAYW